MKYKIIVDSASDLKKDYLKDSKIGFSVVPLKINIGDKEFVDNENIDIADMLKSLHEYNGKTSTACPAPQDFLDCMEEADNCFVITITSGLSGTYNSAMNAKNAADKSKNVHIIDSLSTCGSEILIVNRLVELIEAGEKFEDIVTKIEKYRNECKLLFVLQKFDNLIANGRMSKAKALIANVLSIKLICQASEKGDIEVCEKAIGSSGAFKKMITRIGKYGTDFKGRKLYISHCVAKEEAMKIKEVIAGKYNFDEIIVIPMSGLASYYALEKGIIVCF